MCELVTNVTFFVNRIIDHLIGCVGVTVSVYIKKNKAVIGLEKEPIHSKRQNGNLCFFRCLALHRGCDRYRLEPVKRLYEAYDQDDVAMEDFAGVMLDDHFRVMTTFETNVRVYKLVESDAENEKTTVNSSVDHYIITPSHCTSTFTRHTFPISKMYACTVILIDVESVVTRCGNTHICCADTGARARGVCVESIQVACTIRPRQCSNVWTTRTFESPNLCGTTCTEPPLTLSVGLTPHNLCRTVTRSTG